MRLGDRSGQNGGEKPWGKGGLVYVRGTLLQDPVLEHHPPQQLYQEKTVNVQNVHSLPWLFLRASKIWLSSAGRQCV